MTFNLPETSGMELFTPVDAYKMADSHFRELALQAVHKPVLTDAEKFAICWVTGVPCEVVPIDIREPIENHKVNFRTTVPCSVTRRNGKWHVTRMQEERKRR